ncbi:MAG: recombinase family protein [Streptosporangiaceae bacterium]
MDEIRPLRAIVARRLSNLTDATTHLVTETESTQEFCKRKKYVIVAETEDLDVSGGKPIRERPGVGPWLTVDHLDDWDVLVLYKLDRGFRNHLDFVNFYHEFCEFHGKQIVSVNEEIDMSTRMGRFIAGILVQFAEWEIENMSQRRAAAAKVIRRKARWGGGSFTFGYLPKKEGNYWYLEPHPVYAEETRRMAEAAVAGMPAGRIAVDLNERDVPTARDVQNEFSGKPHKRYQWTTHAVVQHLRSDATRGYVLHYPPASKKGEPKPPPVRVVDETGEFVRREPLIDDELWFKLQEALDASTKKLSGKRAGGAALLQIAFCGYCGAALHKGGSAKSDGRTNDYYQCRYMRKAPGRPHCQPSRSIPKERLEQTVFDGLLDAVGHCEVTTKTVIAGDDHSQTLRRLGAQIADLTTQHYMHGGVPDFHARMAALEAEHTRISDLPREKPKIRRVSTGKTFAQLWEEMDSEQRQSYLKSAGVTALVVRSEDFTQSLVFHQTTDVADNAVLDIPVNVIRQCGDFVVNISLGTLAEQLQRASSATVSS